MELIYLLFIISGWLKAYLSLFGISLPIDITIIFAGLLIYNIILKWNQVVNRNIIIAIFFLLLFYFWMLITLFYTPSVSYSKLKALYFLLNIIAFVYPILIRDFNINKFFRLLVLFSFFLGVINISVILAYQIKLISYNTYSPWKDQYLGTGMYLGLSVVTIFCSRFELFRQKSVSYLLFFISITFLILSAARGPVIFATFISFLYWLFVWQKAIKFSRYINRNLLLLLSSFLIIAIIFSRTILVRFIYRFNDLIASLINESGEPLNPRLFFLKEALKSITENWQSFLFGKGIASYGVVVYNIDGRFYPHNIIIEVLFEFGLIGLIIFTFFIIYSLNKISKTNFLIFSFFYLFLNALKSYSLIDLRILFALVAFVAIYNINKISEFKTKDK